MAKEPNTNKLQEDAMENETVDANLIPQLRSILQNRHAGQIIILFFAMCIGAVLELAGVASVPLFVSLLIDSETSSSFLPFKLGDIVAILLPQMDIVLGSAALIGAFFLIKNAYLAGVIYLEGRTLRNVTVTIARRLYTAYLHAPFELHLYRNPADSIRNLTTEVEQIRQLLRTGMQAFREVLVLVLLVGLLLAADPVSSAAAFILLGSSAAIFFLTVKRRLRFSGYKIQQHRARQFQWINQGLSALPLAKLMKREKYLTAGFQVEMAGKEHELFLQKFLAGMPRLFLELAALFAILIIAGTITLLQRDPASLLPTLALLSVTVVRMIPTLVAITSAASQLESGRAALSAVHADIMSFEESAPQRTPTNLQQQPTEHELTLDQLVCIDEASFRFMNADENTLENISFTIDRGEAVGIVGPSGSGKSTLVAMMMGLLHPTAGNIYVRQNQDRRTPIFGYVPQQVYLLDQPVRNNIAFGLDENVIDQSAVETAAKAAQIHDFILDLPDGYDTQTGERGARLSGGQIQRLGIARALYHNPEILMMDEATSALDGETEKAVIEAIESLKGTKTIVLIAHRLNTIKFCSRVIKLEKGRLVANGDPNVVLHDG